MSRLIFEGDTRERFGELFPKPFIEQVRVFDDRVETDVGMYFKIEEDISATEFLENTGLSNLKIYIGPIGKLYFDRAQNGEIPIDISDPFNAVFSKVTGNLPFLINSQITEYLTQALGDYSLLEPSEIDVTPFSLDPQRSQFFYNSEGDKFIKFSITDSTWQWRSLNQEQYIISVCYFPTVNSSSADPLSNYIENLQLFKDQFSEVSFVKVFNSDDTINYDKQQVYIESDGNYYNNTPMMSLDRRFRKTNIINHQQVISTIQPIIQPYVDSIEDASLISSVLQEYHNSPRLLTILAKNINKFSNKSSATTIGTVYGQLVNAISDIDSILVGSEIVEKRLIINSKIKDMRNAILVSGEQLNVSATLAMNSLSSDSFFLRFPYLTRQVHPKQPYDTQTDYDLDDFFIENRGYFFFDFEKALNYQSQISQFFNPYNILHIFGRNALNQYFYLNSVSIKKIVDGDSKINLKSDPDVSIDESKSIIKNFVVSGLDSHNFQDEFAYTQANRPKFELKSFLAERACASLNGRRDYKLRCFEFVNLESAEQAVKSSRYIIEVEIKDRTIDFFDSYLRNKMSLLLDDLKSYLEYAEQFCSYSNIDERFNNFFINSLEEQFSEPYVWDESPIFYHAINSILNMSWKENGNVEAGRKKNGTLANLEQLSDLSSIDNKNINPRTGDLSSLRLFVTKFENFYNNYLGYNSVWSELIWATDSGTGFTPEVMTRTNRSYTLQQDVTTNIIDSYDIEDYRDYDSGVVEDEDSAFIRDGFGIFPLSERDGKVISNYYSSYVDFMNYLAANINSFYIYTKDRNDTADSQNSAIFIDEIADTFYENPYTNGLRAYIYDSFMSNDTAWSSFFEYIPGYTANELSQDDVNAFVAGTSDGPTDFVKFMRILIPFYEFHKNIFGYSNIAEVLETIRLYRAGLDT